MLTKGNGSRSGEILEKKILLTIGISTFNRTYYLLDRLTEFQKLGYFHLVTTDPRLDDTFGEDPEPVTNILFILKENYFRLGCN